MTAHTTSDVARYGTAMLDELEKAIVGKRDVLKLLLTGIFASGHVLFEDVPGLAKTLIARSIAQVADLDFSRVQFTPDLVPGDITGSTLFEAGSASGTFKPGPVFANLVLGDEINRAPPKTQSAVLEAMEERQVTVDGGSHPVPWPFIVIATQNPIESGGTYPLPEAQLDRFLLRLNAGYPDLDAETEILVRRAGRGKEEVSLDRVIDADTLRDLQITVEAVQVERSVAVHGRTRDLDPRLGPHRCWSQPPGLARPATCVSSMGSTRRTELRYTRRCPCNRGAGTCSPSHSQTRRVASRRYRRRHRRLLHEHRGHAGLVDCR